MRAIQLRCGTWNIHRAKGSDGRVDPGRIERCLSSELQAASLDVLTLQEADDEKRPHGRILNVGSIAEQSGLTYQHEDADMRWGSESDGFLGTIVFLHPRFTVTHRDVLDLPGHCHRGAVIIEMTDQDVPFRVISAHLSLTQMLRAAQMRIIGQYLYRRPEMQTILLGDFNEWRPWGGLMFHPKLVGRSFSGPVRATFPAKWPALPLDRIMSDRAGAVSGLERPRSALLVEASDHLPLVGNITVTRGSE